MELVIKRFVIQFIGAFVLWTNGWRRRKCRQYQELYIEWKDPESGLWFSEGVAMKLAMARARDQVR
jgi:hypothetical protein